MLAGGMGGKIKKKKSKTLQKKHECLRMDQAAGWKVCVMCRLLCAGRIKVGAPVIQKYSIAHV